MSEKRKERIYIWLICNNNMEQSNITIINTLTFFQFINLTNHFVG